MSLTSEVSESGIARMLELPTTTWTTASSGHRRCASYLLARPLSVEPIVRPIMRAGGIPAADQQRLLSTLRLFRAAVRGVDDLLDRSDAEPSGRPAAWRLFGAATTAGSALHLWGRSIESVPNLRTRSAVLAESACMVRSACLEGAMRRAAGTAALPVPKLAGLERRIRDKEWAYWRLVAALIGGEWRTASRRWNPIADLLIRLADNWQRTDDVRDFEEDLGERRLSSFVVDLLRHPPGREDDPVASVAPVPWLGRIEALVETHGPELDRRRELLLRSLDCEQTRILAAIDCRIAGIRDSHSPSLQGDHS
ncbi:MAG: class 1 isoprenoid biosynthesis enzyme [bacterium]|nr:class 1 isoprenoid biosynthesis enzyme [bacterium]